MKHSNSFILEAMCFAMISLIGMSSCAKSTNDKQAANSSLEVWEMYDAQELAPVMNAINETTMELENPLYVILSGMDYPYGPVLGTAFYNDTAAVMAMLNTEAAKSLLPADLRLAWSAYPAGPRASFYQLMALKAKDGKPAMYGDLIQDAQVMKNQYRTYPSILVTFNEQAAKQWADITEANIGKCLALVVEGKVYSYPVVQDKITGGKCEIFSPMEEDEAEALAKKIKP